MLAQTGKIFTAQQLQKRWSNIQSRLKEKLKYSRGTGGGPPQLLSNNDSVAHDIIGANSPKLSRVPGAIENVDVLHREITTAEKRPCNPDPTTQSCSREDGPRTNGSLPSRSMSCKRKRVERPPLESLEDLHRSVMELQRQKLFLKIQLLRQKTVLKHDAATQTDINTSDFGYLRYILYT